MMVLVPPTEAPKPLPYCAAVTPVCSQAAKLADACVAPLFVGAHGSTPTAVSWPYDSGLYSSTKFGALIARSNEKRARTSGIGAYCTSNLKALVLPATE